MKITWQYAFDLVDTADSLLSEFMSFNAGYDTVAAQIVEESHNKWSEWPDQTDIWLHRESESEWIHCVVDRGTINQYRVRVVE